ncbi:MAG TPA: carboxypeptidase M32 [Anaerolineae bacterium]
MEDKLQALRARLTEASDLEMVGALLSWDQSTYMPEGGAAARGRQSGLISRLAHDRAIDPAIGRLLDELQPFVESLPYDSDDAALVRVARRDYERAIRVPSDFVAAFANHQAESYQVWASARSQSNFKAVQPYLEKTLEYSRRLAGFYPGYAHVADPLIDQADPGLTVAEIQPLFADLRARLVPLVEAIGGRPPADDSVLGRYYPEAGQWAFGIDVVKCLGYDFERGRLDKTHHPFTTKFSLGDVRITTRVDEYNFGDAFFSTVHEAGHAIYEQGIRRDFEGTPLGGGTSSGVHESQSRLWENIVGRSRPFWDYFYPRLQAVFPEQLQEVTQDTFYRAVNKVERSLIRTDADEVTYNLHVMLRFDLELALLEGKLAVRDLPEAWNARMKSDLGIEPPNDRLGVLQDVHWFAGTVGGVFQGYTLGNILNGQFYQAALQAQPEIPGQIREGEFATLRAWLTENIYQHGSKFTTNELVRRVTGGPLSIEPYLAYLQAKYGELYQL